MSSLYVRQKVKEWCEALPTPFYNTVNIEQNPTDIEWNTVQWQFADINKETFCDNVEEGLFTILWFGQSGVGEDSLLELAENELMLFMANIDDHVFLENYHAPYTYITSESLPQFVISYDIEYRYDGYIPP